MPSIYIINPRTTEPSYHTAEVLDDAEGGWVQVADLAIVTVAALAPVHWDVSVADEAIAPVDLDAEVDFVAITGKVTQRERMIALAAAFRSRGRTVLIGGSFATLSPDDMRPHADILVTGEIEGIAPGLFADLENGRWAASYDGGKADIRLTPVPRWDLYPVDRALSGCIQTTRGCPFSCEFCDVIQYQGRKQRHKNIDQIVRELDALHEHGFRRIFIADDNFAVHRKWAYTVLEAMTNWNARHADDPLSFVAQTSMDIAREDELLEACRAAGIVVVFVGIETINEESLRETRKPQNLLLPIEDAVNRIIAHGIAVHAGIIVGFDHDGADIFDLMKRFFAASPLPQVSVGVLVAPQATDLYKRLEREGRIDGAIWEASAQGPFATNISPLLMTRDELLTGVTALARSAFETTAYRQRIMQLIERHKREETVSKRPRHLASQRGRAFLLVARKIAALGSAEAAMMDDIFDATARNPSIAPQIAYFLTLYAQTRFVLDRPETERLAA